MSTEVVWRRGDPYFQLEHGGQYTVCFDLKPIGGVGAYWLMIDPKVQGFFGEGGFINMKLAGGNVDIWAPTTEVTDDHEWLMVDVNAYSPHLLAVLSLIAVILGITVALAVVVLKVVEETKVGGVFKGIGDALQRLAAGGWMTPLILVAAVVTLIMLLPALAGSGKKAAKELS